MDPLPALHPVVIKPISSPPFKYSPKGLTFKDHWRESAANLKQWLFPKQKNAAPLKKVKDWWLAQLRLYGIEAKSSTRVADLTQALKDALSQGMDGPTEAIRQLELKLEREFLLENEEARNKEYPTLSDEQKAWKYSDRFLREKFLNGRNDEELLALEIGGGPGDVHEAAARILEGTLRSSADLPPESTCFPVTPLPFTWRGRETGENMIQLDYRGDTNLGSFDFLSKTKLKGILKSCYGNFPFTGCKVAKVT